MQLAQGVATPAPEARRHTMGLISSSQTLTCRIASGVRCGSLCRWGLLWPGASFIQFTVSLARRRPYPRDPHALQIRFSRKVRAAFERSRRVGPPDGEAEFGAVGLVRVL